MPCFDCYRETRGSLDSCLTRFFCGFSGANLTWILSTSVWEHDIIRSGYLWPGPAGCGRRGAKIMGPTGSVFAGD